MSGLNITYYFGQIKPEYRGQDVLFLDVPEDGEPNFYYTWLKSGRLEISTQNDLRFPIRTYIGVNQRKAQAALEARLAKEDIANAFDLDKEIVLDRIVNRRLQEVNEIVAESSGADLRMAIRMGS